MNVMNVTIHIISVFDDSIIKELREMLGKGIGSDMLFLWQAYLFIKVACEIL